MEMFEERNIGTDWLEPTNPLAPGGLFASFSPVGAPVPLVGSFAKNQICLQRFF